MSVQEDPLREVRIGKRGRLKALGINPYPYSFERTHEAEELERRYAGLPSGAEGFGLLLNTGVHREARLGPKGEARRG
jgi:lysyl-tRNA synthetase class II